MSAKSYVNIVVNAPAGSGADLTRPGNGRVLVTGDTDGFLRPKVKSIALKPFLDETLASIRVTATATPAANTVYRFVISQQSTESRQNSAPKQFPVEVYFDSAPSATVFANTVTAVVDALIDSGELKAGATAYTSGNGGVDIVGLTGYALVVVEQPTNVTIASQLASGTSTGNLSASGTTLTMLQSTTTAFAVGKLVKLSGWTGTAVINGRTAAQGVILRVSAVTASTNVKFVADTITGSISAAATDYEVIATEERGLGSDLSSERGIVGSNADLVAATVYHEVVVDYLEPSGSTMTVEDGAPIQKHYFIDASTSAANGLALLTQFDYVDQWLDSAGSAVDPLLL